MTLYDLIDPFDPPKTYEEFCALVPDNVIFLADPFNPPGAAEFDEDGDGEWVELQIVTEANDNFPKWEREE